MCDDSGTVWTNQGLDYSGQMTATDQSEASNIKLSKRLRKCMFYIYTLLSLLSFFIALLSSIHNPCSSIVLKSTGGQVLLNLTVVSSEFIQC